MIFTKHNDGDRVEGVTVTERLPYGFIAISERSGGPREGFCIVGHPLPYPQIGDCGSLVFTQGGPCRGYWHFHPSENSPS